MDESGSASRTAVLVCQGRAAAHGRLAPGRFDDPTAAVLLHPDERDPVEAVRAGVRGGTWSARVRLGLVAACAEIMVPRTVAIDDAVRERSSPQLVILGAGLDGRAWRMAELAGTVVYEVDHPASQADKRARAGALPPARARQVHLVPVDLTRDDLAASLAAAGHRQDAPTTWVWEGVIPYLTHEEVAATLALVRHRSAPGSRLVANYQAPGLLPALGRRAVRVLTVLAGGADPLSSEPFRSTWTPRAFSGLLAQSRFTPVRDDDTLTLASRLGMTTRARASLANGRVVVADV